MSIHCRKTENSSRYGPTAPPGLARMRTSARAGVAATMHQRAAKNARRTSILHSRLPFAPHRKYLENYSSSRLIKGIRPHLDPADGAERTSGFPYEQAK